MTRGRIFCVAAVVAALVAATPVSAQRLSLAERVTALENKANADAMASGNANLEAQNRIVALQGEVSALRDVIEQLQHEMRQLKEANRLLAADIDSRLGALEEGAAPAPAASRPTPEPQSPPPRADARAPQAGFTDVPAEANPSADRADAGSVSAADPAQEQDRYQQALDTLVERFEAAESARLFQSFIRDYPDSPLIANAWYWLGESYYVTQNFELAVEAFATLLEVYPGSRKEPDALLKLGYCRIALGERSGGEAVLRDLLDRYPGSDAALKAESRLRTLALESR
ncbi:tol-pal system protein YbgF [Arenimonas composti]|uniref:Cell division coordinator CpoB n=1 Tax=Arenimonas composti TR7-09 = DSM 18010 TaxID=1121013 RepID=A0A091C3J1_9GAMM|nr:tol-pal system protein YbgF [Arenimonas composti]KFN51225.1 hypothetical protein P873_02890 [Arenimonas composti TR7-09 = DSM 18010]